MSIKLGICGVGAFAECFIPLFNAHPAVSAVVLCDLDAEKLRAKSEKFEIPSTCPSLDKLCETDVDAIAIITQPHLHGPQAMQALRAGKHVYSAVPPARSVAELEELVRTVEETGRIYMLGETSYYYPSAIYCRGRFRKGDFGHIVYGEGEYYHDVDHGLREVWQWRHGEEWKRRAGSPPLYYPTHSVSLIVSVTGARVTHVSAFGFEDRHPDKLYQQPDAVHDNPFSNETMLCRLSDGSMARFNEFRRIGHPGREGMRLYGTEGSYEDQSEEVIWQTKNREKREDLSELLRCGGVPAGSGSEKMDKVDAGGTHMGVSRVHPIERLPKEFVGLPNGHRGSHQFLVDDFVRAADEERQPPNHVWRAARYMLPGLIGHESAMQGGKLLEVPDFGDGPQ